MMRTAQTGANVTRKRAECAGSAPIALGSTFVMSGRSARVGRRTGVAKQSRHRLLQCRCDEHESRSPKRTRKSYVAAAVLQAVPGYRFIVAPMTTDRQLAIACSLTPGEYEDRLGE